jgi:hypothetical protein
LIGAFLLEVFLVGRFWEAEALTAELEPMVAGGGHCNQSLARCISYL